MPGDQGYNQEIRSTVRDVYSAIARVPFAEHPIPVGRELALGVGYPAELLNRMPAVAVEAFAGVSNVSLFAELPEGSRVLDLGCGAGLDSFVASERVGPDGQVIGVDFSESMLRRASQATAQENGVVSLCLAESDRLPLREAAFDVALVNGIFNLNPNREAIFAELHRVLRPGGVVYASELILRERLSEEEQQNEANWFA